jgi:N-formylglutamate amidohydrolase
MNTSLSRIGIFIGLWLIPFYAFSQTYIPGNIYTDPTGFVEYRAGNLPIIFSAPHGGNLEPNSIPNRDCEGCVTINDAFTKSIAEGVYDEFVDQTGCYPHLVINLLHRKKFDANRDIRDAADGNSTVEEAWYGYHQFIDSAKLQVEREYGRGLFLDLHGHGHNIQRIELGYLLSRQELQKSDADLNSNTYIKESSLRSLVGDNIQGFTHVELLRGQNSLGALLHEEGFRAVPSLTDPYPRNTQAYFSGGYNTQRHGSRDDNGAIDAIQIELNQDIRFEENVRETLIKSLVTTIIEYVDLHYGGDFCQMVSSNPVIDFKEVGIKIFPNPATDYFEMDSEVDRFEIRIYNTIGQAMILENWSGGRINITSLPRGYYFVQFIADNSIIGTAKLLKNE